MTTTANLEVEVKFQVADLVAFREMLVAAGAEMTKPRVYERNIRFDTADNSLLKKWQLLRLRQDRDIRVTFKGPVAEDRYSEAKVREELEVQVDDFDTMAAILKRIGFEPLQEYQKYRETFRIRGIDVVLDELPFGNFVELEGDENLIKKEADELGLDWGKRILNNYLAMMSQVKAIYNLPFDDLTFDNFTDLEIDIAWHLLTPLDQG